MGVGYSKKDRAVTLPWRHADGGLANMKYRKVFGKYFWYFPGGEPIKNLVYGADYIYRHNITEAVVCEAEIDALTWLSVGKPAIALGGSTITERKLDIIRRSPLESVVICPDNDDQGEKMRRKLTEGLRGFVELKAVEIPEGYKDANEAHCKGVDLTSLLAKELPMKFDIRCRK